MTETANCLPFSFFIENSQVLGGEVKLRIKTISQSTLQLFVVIRLCWGNEMHVETSKNLQ